MFSLQTIKHSEASNLDLDRAIAIKQVAWPYSKESQMHWMQNNLHPNDVHVFLQEDGQDVAYLNIAWVNACINGVDMTCAGIGNVCAKVVGKRYGERLIISVLDLLSDSNKIGLLFCRSNLVDFYSKYNWVTIPKERVYSRLHDDSVCMMVFNSPMVYSLVYTDRSF